MKIVTIVLLGGTLLILSDILAYASRAEDARETLVTYQLNDAQILPVKEARAAADTQKDRVDDRKQTASPAPSVDDPAARGR